MTDLDWADLEVDVMNANAGTERGQAALERSLRELGPASAITLDRKRRIIGGNKTAETAAALGLGLMVVKPPPGVVVAVQRDDLDLYDDADPRGRDLATALNRVAELNLAWVDEMLQAAETKGSTARQTLWWEREQEELTIAAAQLAQEELPPQEPLDPPKAQHVSRKPIVIAECADENEQANVIDWLEEQGIKWRTP